MTQDKANKWQKLWQPSNKWYLLWLPTGGILAIVVGVLMTASFNGIMAYTNSNEFCYSCHIGMDTIVEEYQDSVHFSKRRGVPKADCADCHVPKEFVPKMIVKIKATKDIYHMLAGTVTLENFESQRLGQAQHVWDDMVANQSKSCKTCHDVENWDLAAQPTRARVNHDPQKWAEREISCIDCHQGVAHKVPRL